MSAKTPTRPHVSGTPPPEPGKLLPRWRTPSGWAILQVGWWNVPDYDFAAASRGMSADDIERELNLSWAHTKGKRVTPLFGKLHIASEPIAYDAALPLHCGWDPATVPSFVVTQLNAFNQWCVLSCVQADPEKAVSILDFSWRCAKHLQEQYADPLGREYWQLPQVHIGDPAMRSKPAKSGEAMAKIGSPKETRSAMEIIRDGVMIFMGSDEDGDPIFEHSPGPGFDIVPGEVTFSKRLEALNARLKMIVDGDHSGFIVDPDGGELIVSALGGGWHYHQRSSGQYELDPFKDECSDIADALCYVATRLHLKPQARDEDHGGASVREYVSQASGRRRR